MGYVPHGLESIIHRYGDARAYVDMPAIWEEMILRYVAVPEDLFLFSGKPVRRLRCHDLATGQFGKVIHTLYHGGLREIEYGGTYAFRLNRVAPEKLSTHCWGIAIDLNPTRCHLGGDPALQDPRIVAAFADAGFTWGGTFKHPDGMHFQLASGY